MLDKALKNAKSGSEFFTLNQQKLFKLIHFWQWSSSDLLSNSLRGKLAEFIVVCAIGKPKNVCEQWGEYDLITDEGIKIEVKSSSYIQSWNQTKLSKISFGIQPTGKSQVQNYKKSRKADIYVFCVLAHKDKNTVNPLKLEQWDFYILPTAILNKKAPIQKTISLSSLLKLNPVCTKYEKLAQEVAKIQSLSVL